MNLSLSGIRILLVEDDEDNLELTEYLLREQGASVATARSAAQVREILGASPVPDVIVSDLSLPDEDGCAMLASLRAREATAKTPAIALTAQAEDAALLRAAKAGFVRYLTKPAELVDILEAIGAVVGRAVRAGDAPPLTGRALRERLVGYVARGDLAGLVALLGEQAPYRFTSLHRFDVDATATLASFDREYGGPPPCVAVGPSYSVFVRSQRAPFVVADAATEARLSGHPLRGHILAYCGVPLVRPDGSLFGALCYSDTVPRAAPDRAVAMLDGVARMLRSELSAHEAVGSSPRA